MEGERGGDKESITPALTLEDASRDVPYWSLSQRCANVNRRGMHAAEGKAEGKAVVPPEMHATSGVGGETEWK